MQNFPSCRSVFQSGGAQPDSAACTRAWLRLLNAMERARALPEEAAADEQKPERSVPEGRP